jgi:hypothetical protein
MESIYYVLCWQCHRRCVHCYEDRFRPYYGAELEKVVADAQAAFPKVIANLPPRLTFLDPQTAAENGAFPERRGRIILAGGEILHKAVRETILYPAVAMLRERYREAGGVEIIIQTTGDLVTESIAAELLALGVSKISVSGMDQYHEGLAEEAEREALRNKLTRIFESLGMTHDPGKRAPLATDPESTPAFSFFGATPDAWIGKLWPRGRALQNELSTATLEDNFCNRWSGGLNFLQYRLAESEVSIDPDGNVYPCCIKTKKALGSLQAEPLEAILDRLTGNPVYEAISMGHPERMGITHGWSVEKFLERSQTTLPSGKPYRNLCIACDAFHTEVLLNPLITLKLKPDAGADA